MKINRRTFVAGMGAAAAATAGSGLLYKSYKSYRNAKLPNIILFLADDLRYDTLGYLGNKIIKTPVLDALAKKSVVFENNFVTTSICPISRASILTGQYCARHGVRGFGDGIHSVNGFLHSYINQLHEAGYYTCFIGKWGIGGTHPHKAVDSYHGFDGQGNYYERPGGIHNTDWENKLALEFLQNRPDDQPFLLVVSYKAPHDPLQPQQRYAGMYQDVEIPRTATDTREAFNRVPPLVQHSMNRHSYMKHCGTNEQYQSYVKKYYRLVTGLDESIGTILAALDKSGARDRTSIFFTSDNGQMLGEHGLSGKWCMYEESIRVPLLIQPAKHFYPGLKPHRSKAMTLNIDISPTMMGMAGIPIPSGVTGMDIMTLLAGKNTWREGFYYEHPPMLSIIPCKGWRGKEWKYTRYYQRRERNELLFNLLDDPGELDNLADQSRYKPILEEMQRITNEQHDFVK